MSEDVQITPITRAMVTPAPHAYDPSIRTPYPDPAIVCRTEVPEHVVSPETTSELEK